MTDLEFRTRFGGTPLIPLYEACTAAEREELWRVGNPLSSRYTQI